jgi:hypothetical protein
LIFPSTTFVKVASIDSLLCLCLQEWNSLCSDVCLLAAFPGWRRRDSLILQECFDLACLLGFHCVLGQRLRATRVNELQWGWVAENRISQQRIISVDWYQFWWHNYFIVLNLRIKFVCLIINLVLWIFPLNFCPSRNLCWIGVFLLWFLGQYHF